MAKQDDVSLLDDVFLPFQADLGAFPGRRHASGSEEIVPAHHFSADEAAFDVRVDGACSLLRVRSSVNCPGTNLRLAGCKK